MSYDIVYSKQFIRLPDEIEDKYLPLVLIGSSNCYEPTANGKQRRVREWALLFPSKSIAMSERELMAKVNSLIPSTYDQHFMCNGKWVGDSALVRFVRSGIQNAKTLEQLNSMCRVRVTLGCSLRVYSGTSSRTLKSVSAQTSKEVWAFIDECEEQELEEGERAYPCFWLPVEDMNQLLQREYKRIKAAPLNHGYILVSRDQIFVRLTKNGYKCSRYAHSKVRIFKTADDAEKYIDKNRHRLSWPGNEREWKVVEYNNQNN